MDIQQKPVIYCKKGCSTCKKALNWLDEKHVDYIEKEITEERPDEEAFLTYFRDSSQPIRSFFNTRGVQFKKMDLKNRLNSMTDEEKAALLAQNGMLIRRPLLVYRGEALTGFNAEKWSSLLNLNG